MSEIKGGFFYKINNSMVIFNLLFLPSMPFFSKHAYIVCRKSSIEKIFNHPFVDTENLKRVKYHIFSKFQKIPLLERINCEFYMGKDVNV